LISLYFISSTINMIVRDKHSSRAWINPKVDDSSGVYGAGVYVSQYTLASRQNCVQLLSITREFYRDIVGLIFIEPEVTEFADFISESVIAG